MYSFSLLLIAIILAVYAYWQFGYVNQLDWRTAYKDYTGWECSPCWDFFEKLDQKGLDDLQQDSVIGALRFIAQAHLSDGYRELSESQLKENDRARKLLTLMINKGVDPNFVPENSIGVLFSAVTSADVTLVEFLLEKGADPKVTNYVRGQPITCLELAQQNLQKAKQAEKTAMNQRLVESLTKIVGLLEQAQSQ